MEKFNLNNFFRDGFTFTKIDELEADQLLQAIKRDEYIEEEDVYSLDNPSSVALKDSWDGVIHPKAPSWDKKSPFNSAPNLFHDFWKNLSESEYFSWFPKLYGSFTHRTIMAHKYNKDDGMGWHYDVTDATLLLNILYLTDDTWNLEDGGYLEVGHCNITGKGIPIKDTVESKIKILPNHGTLVTISNYNPSVLHKVEKLFSDKTRYALVCQLGYFNNVINKETKKYVRG
jgi:hypothetical protein